MTEDLNELSAGMLAERFLDLWDDDGAPPDVNAFLAAHRQASPQERLEVILVDQHRRTEAGCPRTPESYLAAHSDVAADADRRVAVVYEDYRLRLERGEAPDPQEYLVRFPDLREALGRQFNVAGWMAKTGDSVTAGYEGDKGMSSGVDGGVTDLDAESTPLSTSDFDLGPAFPEGGMGVVCRAWQKSLRRRVALKFLKDVRSPESIRRFLQEARTVARLRHPGIVPIFGLGRSPDSSYFLIMDLVDGPSLAERMKVAAIRPARAAEYIADAAEAIQHAHDQGVIHRDLKPGNILVDRPGRALVTDFGLAKWLDAHAPGESHPDQIIGTPEYMAPEQVDPRWGPIGPPTDIYGLGATLYTLLTGRPPFIGSNRLDLLRQIASDEPPAPIRSLHPEVPEGLEAICLKCLQKDPSDRYASAIELARELRTWQATPMSAAGHAFAGTASDRAKEAAPTLRPGPRPTPWRRGLEWLLAALILVPLAAGLFFALLPSTYRVAPAKIEVFDIFRGRNAEKTTPLTVLPGPLATGDGVKVQCRLSRPAYPYLFWIDSAAEVATLYPEDLAAQGPVDAFHWPPNTTKLRKIEGNPGTEVAVLIVRDEPLAAEDLSRLRLQLRPTEPLPALDRGTVLVDGNPIEKSRGFGELEDMFESRVIAFLEKVNAGLRPGIGTVRTVALPHVEKR